MKLAWTRSAHANRKAIRERIAADNPAAALAMDALFSKSTQRLLEYPHMGRDGRVRETRELVVHPNYVLVYDIHADTLRVLRLLHAAQQWPTGQ